MSSFSNSNINGSNSFYHDILYYDDDGGGSGNNGGVFGYDSEDFIEDYSILVTRVQYVLM
jgi:hypothetical protein